MGNGDWLPNGKHRQRGEVRKMFKLMWIWWLMTTIDNKRRAKYDWKKGEEGRKKDERTAGQKMMWWWWNETEGEVEARRTTITQCDDQSIFGCWWWWRWDWTLSLADRIGRLIKGVTWGFRKRAEGHFPRCRIRWREAEVNDVWWRDKGIWS